MNPEYLQQLIISGGVLFVAMVSWNVFEFTRDSGEREVRSAARMQMKFLVVVGFEIVTMGLNFVTSAFGALCHQRK